MSVPNDKYLLKATGICNNQEVESHPLQITVNNTSETRQLLFPDMRTKTFIPGPYRSSSILDFGLPANPFNKGLVATPCIIKDGNIYKMWYFGSEDHALGTSYIGYAVSNDGIKWAYVSGDELPGPGSVLTRGAGFESKLVYAPSVIKENGMYKMWYTGWDAAMRTKTGLAESNDGKTWNKYNGNGGPVLTWGGPTDPDKTDAGMPYVIKENGVYKMWYTASDNSGVTWTLCYATSTDGINWTKHGKVVDISPGKFDSRGVTGPSVIKTNDIYEMWYSGIEAPFVPDIWRIGYAQSRDGINWQKIDGPKTKGSWYEGSQINGRFDKDNILCQAVLREENTYKIWYGGSIGPFSLNTRFGLITFSP